MQNLKSLPLIQRVMGAPFVYTMPWQAHVLIHFHESVDEMNEKQINFCTPEEAYMYAWAILYKMYILYIVSCNLEEMFFWWNANCSIVKLKFIFKMELLYYGFFSNITIRYQYLFESLFLWPRDISVVGFLSIVPVIIAQAGAYHYE